MIITCAEACSEAALDFVREGDVFVCCKLDRLARGVPHLCEIGARLEAKGVALKVLDQAIDTSTPTGRPRAVS
jgi:DNA invertase Pin-like site-specific DNA recombinase